jgi:hypothetical protein
MRLRLAFINVCLKDEFHDKLNEEGTKEGVLIFDEGDHRGTSLR